METVVAMAFATGRTLVMPPAQGMYLLRKDRGKQNTDFSFADFFHLETLSKEHDGIDIISTEEFLKREALTGNLRNKTTGEVAFPPGNRTNWDGQDLKPFKEYMRSVIYTPLWSPGSCLVAFPASGEPQDVEHLHQMLYTIHSEGRMKHKSFENNPTPVDAAPIDRMREALAGRRELCIYDEEMQNAPVIHFMCYHKMRVRLLTHFYSFLFFEDWRHQLWVHRFVRDHLRYLDELQCAAARVVAELRRIATKHVKNNPEGHFDAFHIRRGDFQFKETRLEADDLYARSKQYVPEGSVLYIATDERKKNFFKIFEQHYKVYYLDNFKLLVSVVICCHVHGKNKICIQLKR
jgi:GDP-fucose protein O-fucosyltransferase.